MDDKANYDNIINYIRTNNATELDTILTKIKENRQKACYSRHSNFKNLFSNKLKDINYHNKNYIHHIKKNTENIEALIVLNRHALFQETLNDGEIFLNACKNNHYKTIDMILNLNESIANKMLHHNDFYCLEITCKSIHCQSTHIESFRTIINFIGNKHIRLRTNRYIKIIRYIIERDHVELFKILYNKTYKKYEPLTYEILYDKGSNNYYEPLSYFTNNGAIKCVWWIIHMIKKHKIKVTFNKTDDNYYFQYKPFPVSKTRERKVMMMFINLLENKYFYLCKHKILL